MIVVPEHKEKGWLDWISQILSVSAEPQDREQLIALLRDAQSRDLVDVDVLAMIEGALQVSEQNVRDVMVPRGQMVMVRREAPIEQLLKVITESGHSRFPVVTENKDEVLGVLLAKDLLNYFAKAHPNNFNIREYLRPVLNIPESKRLNALLSEFRTSRNHMAVVVDEYGKVSGLVTIEDVLEQIVGDIDDEHDIDMGDNIFQRDDGLYVLRALTSIDEFNSYFYLNFPKDDFDTVGGMIMHHLGYLPRRQEEIVIDPCYFKVLRADSRRIYMLQLQYTRQEGLDFND